MFNIMSYLTGSFVEESFYVSYIFLSYSSKIFINKVCNLSKKLEK